MLELPLDRRRWLFWLASCCAMLLCGRNPIAQEPLQIQSAVAGFDGIYKAGYWTQILMKLKAGPKGASGRLNLLTEDGDGVPVIFPAEQNALLDLQPGDLATVRLYAKAGPQRSTWQVQLRDGDEDRVLWSQRLNVPPPQRATRELLVTIGADPGVATGASLVKRPEEVSLLIAPVKGAVDLPDRVWGYEGVERLVLIAGENSLVDDLSPQQWVVLHEWVARGGKLILSIGARGSELLEPGQPLAKFVPGKFADLQPLREVSGLAHYASTDFPRKSLTDARRPVVVHLSDRTGRVELEQGGQATNPPLIIRQPYGLGQVIFVALELDHPALVEWKGHTRLMSRLLPLGGPDADNLAAERGHSITHLGYDDLVGQLRTVLDQFTGVTVVSFTAVAVVAITLLLLIGPADYFLIRYFNLPQSITWLTFPAVCLAFAAGTWYLGLLAHGSLTRVNQIEIVDLDVSQGIVRGTLWSHVYSPTGNNLQLSLSIAGNGTNWQQVQGVADWQGLPGEGLGGLSSPQVALDASVPYLISPPGRVALVDSLPLRTASSKALAGRWWGQTELTKDLPVIRLNAYGHLEGDLKNPLPVKFTDCLLASGEWLYRIESLKAGQTIKLSSLTALNLESRLMRREVIDSKDLSTPWNPNETDVSRIMQMLMLHDAVHGPTYTGLSHRYQPQIDLSEHIRLSRAVLMGRADQPAAMLKLAGISAEKLQQQTWTWYRLILPVQARETTATKS